MDCPRVLLLHGVLSAGRAWTGVRRELGPDVTAISPDLAGYGAAPAPTGPYSLETVVDMLATLVELSRPTFVVGHSMGAIVALALAARLPGTFERVGVIGMPIYTTRADGLEYLQHRSPFHRLLLRRDQVTHVGCRALHGTRAAWLPLAPVLAPGLPRHALDAVFDHSSSGHAGSLESIVFSSHVERLARQVDSPVAALHGARDGAAPISRVRDMASANGWDLRVSPTGGHQLSIRRPHLTARWIQERVLRTPSP